jgi:hypothetical protein
VFTSTRETPEEYRDRTGSQTAPATAGATPLFASRLVSPTMT